MLKRQQGLDDVRQTDDDVARREWERKGAAQGMDHVDRAAFAQRQMAAGREEAAAGASAGAGAGLDKDVVVGGGGDSTATRGPHQQPTTYEGPGSVG